MSSGDRCAACGSDALAPHRHVAGDMGARGLVPTTTRFGTALGDIVRCSRCGHGQVSPMPDEDVLAAAYAQAESADYAQEELGQRETARRWLQALGAHAPAGARLLDLGCWLGFLLSEAQARGWQATGVEPSEFASRFARDRLGVSVITGDLFSVSLAPGSFDVVTMNDVIEHLRQPGEALARVRSLLAPGGVLGMVLPDAGSAVARAMGRRWWSVIPTHVQYFTRDSMRTLLARHGFELLSVVTAPKVFTVRYYLDRITGYSPRAGRGLVGAAKAVGVADRLWAPDFRDRMGVIARPVTTL